MYAKPIQSPSTSLRPAPRVASQSQASAPPLLMNAAQADLSQALAAEARLGHRLEQARSHAHEPGSQHGAPVSNVIPRQAGGQLTGGVVQRVVTSNGKVIVPTEHPAFQSRIKAHAASKSQPWAANHETQLKSFLESRDASHEFADDDAVVESLLSHVQGLPTPKMSTKPITAAELQEGHQRRILERLSRATEEYSYQAAVDVPGINKVPNSLLVPLDHRPGEDQEHRWVRHQNQQLALVRKRKTTEPETAVTAFGDPNRPSMTSYRDDRQLAHLYQGIPNGTYAANHSKKRTYGSKKALTGMEYKIKGMVDGHGIQAQNDQKTLSESKAHYPWADQHPHNMYWENSAYGKWVRQKGFEDTAFKKRQSFLHVNEYTDYNNPTKLEASDGNSYIVPDRVHDLIQDSTSTWSYLRFNNSRLANYRDLDHRKTNTDYSLASKWTKSLNKSLGGKPLEHLAANTQPSPAAFPGATVIEPSSATFDFAPAWRYSVPGYQSPPPSPYHTSHFLEEKDEDLPGFHSVGKDLGNDSLVRDAQYDPVTKRTRIKRSRRK